MADQQDSLNTVSNIDDPERWMEGAKRGIRLSRFCILFAAIALAAAAVFFLSGWLAREGAQQIQTAMTLLMLLAVLAMAVFFFREVDRPLERLMEGIRTKQTVTPAGAQELRFVMQRYNWMVEEIRKTTEELTYEAMHDGLTGLYNRNAFEIFCRDTDLEHAAVLIMDVDDFKGINDTYGHDCGDRVLKHVAEVLRHNFRSVDQIYRIGGDEYVVIMTRASIELRDLVLEKVNQVNYVLLQGGEDIPPTSLSVGVAFCDRKNPQGTLLKDADTALYRVKHAGRCGCAVY